MENKKGVKNSKTKQKIFLKTLERASSLLLNALNKGFVL